MTKMRIKKVTAAACLLLAAVSCGKQEQQEEGVYSRRPGDEVVFSTGDGDQPVTKTAYAPGTGQGTINWQEGDLIMVASDLARTPEGESFAHYAITPSGTDATNAVLSNVAPHGLRWGEGVHTFWGLYPSPQMDGAENFVLEEGGGVTLVMPATQAPVGRSDVTASGVTTTTLAPNMLYAPLIACTQVDNTNGGSDAIPLRFKAAFTAFEIVIGVAQADSQLSFSELTVSSAETNLCDEAAWGQTAGTDSDVAFSDFSYDTPARSITVPLETNGEPIVVTAGNKLVVTVFALAFENIHKVTLRFVTERGPREMSLKYSADYFAANRTALISQGKADEDGWLIFSKGKKISMKGFDQPGGFFIRYGDITIGNAPYSEVDPDSGWSIVYYDTSYNNTADGHSFVDQNPDDGWDL